jgi:hypothetical protein
VAYSGCVAITVHASLLPWLSLPSDTHVPPLVTWQYWLPSPSTSHICPAVTGGAGEYIGGGGEGAGGGGGGAAGGRSVRGVALPQIVQPASAHSEA